MHIRGRPSTFLLALMLLAVLWGLAAVQAATTHSPPTDLIGVHQASPTNDASFEASAALTDYEEPVAALAQFIGTETASPPLASSSTIAVIADRLICSGPGSPDQVIAINQALIPSARDWIQTDGLVTLPSNRGSPVIIKYSGWPSSPLEVARSGSLSQATVVAGFTSPRVSEQRRTLQTTTRCSVISTASWYPQKRKLSTSAHGDSSNYCQSPMTITGANTAVIQRELS